MFGIGGFELFIILIFGFLIFGPDKLPDIAKTVGKGIARFREAQQEVNDAIGDEKLIDFDNPDQPFKDPMETLDRIAQRHEEKKNEASKAAGTSGKTAAASDKTTVASGEANDGQAQPESFTERKARYERERAARKAAEAEQKAAEAAAEASETPEGDVAAPAEDAVESSAASNSAAEADSAEGGDA